MKDLSPSDRKQPESVPERGSLGLLALGAVGLKLWRQKREAVKAEKGNNQK
jgi:hypothetical protein